MPPEAEIEQEMRLKRLLQTVFEAFLAFFDDGVDDYASDREGRIVKFVKGEINVHEGEAGQRARQRMEEMVDRLQDELDDPYIRHGSR